MTDQEVLLDLLDTFGQGVQHTVGGMSLDCLRWRPDDEANNIAVTLWHVSRALDLLKVRVLEGRAPEDELWQINGWATQTGYDPRGIGWSGAGNLSGYTQDEVAAVPILPADQLLAYFEHCMNISPPHLPTGSPNV